MSHSSPRNTSTQSALVRLTRAQNGAVKTEQLHAAGLTRHAIQARAKRGALVRQFHSVYTVGDPELMPLARQSAALLSLGPTAALSHRSAAAVWGLATANPATIDVTIAGSNPRPRPGVRIHRVRAVHDQDVRIHANLRLTSPARTLVDFAPQATPAELSQAFGEARATKRLTDAALAGALKRVPANHPGASIVGTMLHEGGTYDRSKAERLMRRHLKAAALPQPIANVMLNGHLVDFLWPDQKLVIEVDGYLNHGSRTAFEADRRRDRAHVAAGYVVVRITYAQLRDAPLAVIASIAQALTQRTVHAA